MLGKVERRVEQRTQLSMASQVQKKKGSEGVPVHSEVQGKSKPQETMSSLSDPQNQKKGPEIPKSPVGLLRKRGKEAIPKMQPSMMMFSSKYWARRGLSLDSAMLDQQHLGNNMVSIRLMIDSADTGSCNCSGYNLYKYLQGFVCSTA